MSNRKPLLLLIVVSLVVSMALNGNLANGENQFFRHARTTQKWCGPKLAKMLVDLCGSPQLKRASLKIEDEYTPLNDYTDQRELDYSGLSGYGALSRNDFSFFAKPKSLSSPSDLSIRTRRGIVEECCTNACSLEHLSQYCFSFQ